MKIFKQQENIFNAVNSMINHGVAVLEGTKTSATQYADRIIMALKPYETVEPIIAYQNVPNHGYLYYLYDANKFDVSSTQLKMLILLADASNKV
nr:hypothetical protein [Acinetobacter sp. Marseille-Q1620]